MLAVPQRSKANNNEMKVKLKKLTFHSWAHVVLT